MCTVLDRLELSSKGNRNTSTRTNKYENVSYVSTYEGMDSKPPHIPRVRMYDT